MADLYYQGWGYMSSNTKNVLIEIYVELVQRKCHLVFGHVPNIIPTPRAQVKSFINQIPKLFRGFVHNIVAGRWCVDRRPG